MKQKLLVLMFVLCGEFVEVNPAPNKEKCGETMLPIPTVKQDYKKGVEISIGAEHWIVRVSTNTRTSEVSAGTFITSKHIITSSQAIVGQHFKYHLDGSKIDVGKECKVNQNYFKVPDKYTTNLKITGGFCPRLKTCKKWTYKPKKAWLLKFCQRDKNEHYGKRMRVMMLIEVEQVDGRSFACVNQGNVFQKNDKGYLYGIDFSQGQTSRMLFREANKFLNETEQFIMVPKYYANGDRGGPLIKIINGHATLMGIGASPAWDDGFHLTFFYDITYATDALCDLIDLCPTRVLTQAPTTQAPTTKAPTTRRPTTRAPTTRPPTTRPPTTRPPTTRPPTTRPPTTRAPTTRPPTTRAPTTKAPTTQALTTRAPTTQAPTTKAPTTQAPTTRPPTTQAPTTQAPTTRAPTTQAPTTRAPTTRAPTTKALTTQALTTQALKTAQASTTQAPSTQAPTTQALKTAQAQSSTRTSIQPPATIRPIDPDPEDPEPPDISCDDEESDDVEFITEDSSGTADYLLFLLLSWFFLCEWLGV